MAKLWYFSVFINVFSIMGLPTPFEAVNCFCSTITLITLSFSRVFCALRKFTEMNMATFHSFYLQILAELVHI